MTAIGTSVQYIANSDVLLSWSPPCGTGSELISMSGKIFGEMKDSEGRVGESIEREKLDSTGAATGS